MGFDIKTAKPVGFDINTAKPYEEKSLGQKVGGFFKDVGRGALDETKRFPGLASSLVKAPFTIPWGVGQTIGQGVGQGIDVATGKVTPTQAWEERKRAEIGGLKELGKLAHPIDMLKERGATETFLTYVPVLEGSVGIVRGAKNVLGKVTLKSLEGAYGVPVKYIKERLARSKEISSAPTPVQFAETKLPEVASKINDGIKQLNKTAQETLSTEKTIDPTTALNAINQAKAKVGKVVTSANSSILKELNTIENNIIGKIEEQKTGVLNVKGQPLTKQVRVGGFGEKLSEMDFADIKAQLDRSIDWGKAGADQMNTILEGLRYNIDGLLKSKNVEYAQIMKPESELIGLNKSLVKNFKLTKEVGEEIPMASNNTVDAIMRAAKDKNMVTQKTINKISEYLGEDLGTQIRDVFIKEEFNRARPAGSKRVNLGIGAGTSIGGGLGYAMGGAQGAATGASIGGFGGTMVGMTMDTGGLALGKMIDRYASMPKPPKILKPTEVFKLGYKGIK